MTKRDLIFINICKGILVTIATVGACAIMYACSQIDTRWREHAAEKHLGSAAVCGDVDDRIVPCVHDGQTFVCIVEGERVSCAKVNRLP